jgi:hypothetical protein
LTDKHQPVAAIASALASASHYFSTGLVDRAKTIKTTGEGRIVVRYGKIANPLLLASAACTIIAMLLWLVMCIWDWKASKRVDSANEEQDDRETQSISSNNVKLAPITKATELGVIVRRTTERWLGGTRSNGGQKANGSAGYKSIDDDSVHLTGYHSHTASQTDLAPMDRNDYSRNSTAYEPFRHQAAVKLED